MNKDLAGRKKHRISGGRIFLYAFVTVCSIIILYPYLVMFFSSLKDLDEIFRIPGTILPEVWRWNNYIDIWSDIPLAYYFRNSAIVAGFATLICVLCAIPGGYALARMQFPGKRFMMAVVIMTQLFSPVVLLVGIYKLMVAFHLQNTLTGVTLMVAAFEQAFAIWILSGTFATISPELEDAARIDGCNKVTALLRVILPLAAPGIVTAVIYVFIAGWNEYTMSLVLIGDKYLKTLNVGIHAFFGYTNTQWWYVFAASLMATIPVLILFSLIEKHLTGGLTAGAVKG